MKNQDVPYPPEKFFRNHLHVQWRTVVWCAVLLFSSLFFPSKVLADVAPPHQPPGSSLSANSTTNVQMLAEQVLINISERTPPPTPSGNTDDQCIANVEATFTMLNQGKEIETMEVWFPLGTDSGFGSTNTLRNFRAWVEEKEVPVKLTKTQNPLGQPIPSAAWQVTFPPEKKIQLKVSYELSPEGYLPFGTFRYILETGSGWYGNIQQATISVQLPYEVNEYNTVLSGELNTPQPSNYRINDKEIVWRFENFEPAAADNISVTVLAPLLWKNIRSAQEQAKAKADSPTAQLALAQALRRALYFKYELVPIGKSNELDQQAEEAFQTALKLDPQSIEIQKEYIDFLEQHWFGYSGTPPPANLLLALAAALDQAPADKDLLRYKQEMQDLGFNVEELAKAARQTASAPTSQPTEDQTPAATATPLPEPSALPTVTALILPSTPTAADQPLPTESERNPTPAAPCLGSLLLSILPIGLIVHRFKRQHN